MFVSISKNADGNFIQKGVWTGLNDIGSEGMFQWSDKSELNYTSWGTAKPNAANKLDDCVKMENSKWNDVSCGQQLSFACERGNQAELNILFQFRKVGV